MNVIHKSRTTKAISANSMSFPLVVTNKIGFLIWSNSDQINKIFELDFVRYNNQNGWYLYYEVHSISGVCVPFAYCGMVSLSAVHRTFLLMHKLATMRVHVLLAVVYNVITPFLLVLCQGLFRYSNSFILLSLILYACWLRVTFRWC